MTDTSSPDTLVEQSSLEDLVSQADGAPCTVKDRWLGKRTMPRTALATLAQASQLLPNPHILIHAVPLLEAQASSEI